MGAAPAGRQLRPEWISAAGEQKFAAVMRGMEGALTAVMEEEIAFTVNALAK
jgi:hypothetical protein